ncbi:YlmC/YmxH family sporulation protein [Domibacillus enclensis]|uniref:Sporulation protein, YlmC/YmxH family n=1 Tax=Domibacillus enclensis TaxID=1017273 RepID=A0A1N6UAU2_9BACI|nr:YlmC/YmxH family sporulation protein [Domibacillus enclensis]OXS78478.1 YlmC/YmxH family sporulation protein [Domibacillus enclensis]SIQ62687.1 sporulation protein, YlmC/YmxH family [Domibacillus enclensis]
MRISDFQLKDIVNVTNGKKLGRIADIELNNATGAISALVIEQTGKKFGLFGKEEEVIIPWIKIVKIGGDVILVRHGELETTEDER